MYSCLIALFVLARTAAPAAAPAAGAKADPLMQVVQRMQKRYEQAGDFRATFSQKYTYAATGRERSSSGELLVKKPGRMRWNYGGPEPQMYLATEGTLWVYEPEAKQAFRQDLKGSQLPAAVSFLMGKGKLSDEFDISVAKDLPYGEPQDHRLVLKPKQPQSTYKAIYLVVDAKTYLVRQSVLVNAQGDVNAITFADVKINTKLADSLFKWTPPADVRVIEAPKAAMPPAPTPAPPPAKPIAKP
jgi:outer membrane lipoprotein carrier protein